MSQVPKCGCASVITGREGQLVRAAVFEFNQVRSDLSHLSVLRDLPPLLLPVVGLLAVGRRDIIAGRALNPFNQPLVSEEVSELDKIRGVRVLFFWSRPCE